MLLENKLHILFLLLQDGKAIEKNVDVVFSDDFSKDVIKINVLSNVQNVLLVNENFSSLGWHVKVSHEGKDVTRSFLILENPKVEFSIEGDKFIIKNKGNVRYTRDVNVKIGEEENVYTQNIPIGQEKIWILVAPEGTYNIEISDGITKFIKSNVHLNSPTTGNVIGVMSGEFHTTGFASSTLDPDNLDEGWISMDKLPIALVFIGAVVGLLVLLFISRKFNKK